MRYTPLSARCVLKGKGDGDGLKIEKRQAALADKYFGSDCFNSVIRVPGRSAHENFGSGFLVR